MTKNRWEYKAKEKKWTSYRWNDILFLSIRIKFKQSIIRKKFSSIFRFSFSFYLFPRYNFVQRRELQDTLYKRRNTIADRGARVI